MQKSKKVVCTTYDIVILGGCHVTQSLVCFLCSILSPIVWLHVFFLWSLYWLYTRKRYKLLWINLYCGHCIVCLSLLYGFWLPLWYLLSVFLCFMASDYLFSIFKLLLKYGYSGFLFFLIPSETFFRTRVIPYFLEGWEPWDIINWPLKHNDLSRCLDLEVGIGA